LIAPVQQLLSDFPFMSAHALSEELGESRTTIRRILKNSLGLSRISLGWVPHDLTPVLMERRSQCALALLRTLKGLGPYSRNRVVTGDKSYVYIKNQPSEIYGEFAAKKFQRDFAGLNQIPSFC